MNQRQDRDLVKMDQWSVHTDGRYLLDVEKKVLSAVLQKNFGYHIVQVGGPTHDHYCQASPIRHKIHLTPYEENDFDGDTVCVDLYQLPLVPSSIDVMVLPHVLESVADPVRVLKRCHDSLIPEGQVVILGFNPFSLWGLAKLIRPKNRVYRDAQFIAPYQLRRMMQEAGFEVQEYKSMCFRLPVKNETWFAKMRFLEPLGRYVWPSCGGIYMMIGRKHEVSMSLVGLKEPAKRPRVRPSIVEPSNSTRSE